MRVEKTDKQWKEQLTPEQYRIARKGGTERAFTGKYWDTKKEGTYANRKTVLSKFRRSAVQSKSCLLGNLVYTMGTWVCWSGLKSDADLVSWCM